MEKDNLSVADLARGTELTESFIVHVRDMDGHINPNNLAKLCNYFGITDIEDLIYLDPDD